MNEIKRGFLNRKTFGVGNYWRCYARTLYIRQRMAYNQTTVTDNIAALGLDYYDIRKWPEWFFQGVSSCTTIVEREPCVPRNVSGGTFKILLFSKWLALHVSYSHGYKSANRLAVWLSENSAGSPSVMWNRKECRSRLFPYPLKVTNISEPTRTLVMSTCLPACQRQVDCRFNTWRFDTTCSISEKNIKCLLV